MKTTRLYTSRSVPTVQTQQKTGIRRQSTAVNWGVCSLPLEQGTAAAEWTLPALDSTAGHAGAGCHHGTAAGWDFWATWNSCPTLTAALYGC